YGAEDRPKIGATSEEFDLRVKDAKEAVQAGEGAAARRLIQQARHAAESAREARYREVVRTTVEMIVAQLGAGRVDAIKARELLKDVEDAITIGQSVDVQRPAKERLETTHVAQIKARTEGASGLRGARRERR